MSALALAIGPVVGGFLTQDVSWRAIFFINPPIAMIAVGMTLFATQESRDETVGRTVDFAGIATLTLGLTALVLALVEANSWRWGSAGSSRCASWRGSRWPCSCSPSAGAGADGRFRLLPQPDILGANVVGFIITFAMFAQFFFLTLYMQNVLGSHRLKPACASCPRQS